MALVRTQVARAIQAARKANRIRPDHEPSAGIALIVARQLDIAAKAGSTGDVVRLSKTLRETLADLPLREVTDDGGPGAGRQADTAVAVAADAGGLAGIVGAPAKVGNTALPG